MASIAPKPQTIGFTGGGSGGGGDPPRRPNRKRPREHEIDNELYAKRVNGSYTKEYMKGKCCCCMKQKHSGTWASCDNPCYWCGKKHVGEWCVEKGLNFYKKHGGMWQRDVASAHSLAPAPQNQRSAGGDVVRHDMERPLNAPRDDVSSWFHGSHAGNADFATPRPGTNERTARTETDEIWRSIQELRHENATWQQRFEQQQQQIAGLEQALLNLQAGVQQYIHHRSPRLQQQLQLQQQGDEEGEEKERSNGEP